MFKFTIDMLEQELVFRNDVLLEADKNEIKAAIEVLLNAKESECG